MAPSLTPTVAARALLRIREEMKRRELNQRDMAGLIGWSQSKTSKTLHGHLVLTVNELEALCFAVQLSLVEAVRDHGYEFCAEMTPTELQVVESLRSLTLLQRDAVLTVLAIRPAARRASTPKSGRPR